MERELDIVDTAEKINAVDKLFNARTTALTYVLTSFINDLKAWLTDQLRRNFDGNDSFRFIYDQCSEEYLKNYYVDGSSCTPIIIIKFPKEYLKDEIKASLDAKNTDYYPCFYIAIEDNLYVSLTIKKNGLNYVDIKPTHSIFRQLLIDNNFSHSNITKYHINWRYIKYNSKLINFKDYKDPRNGVLRLLGDRTLSIKSVAMENIKNDIYAILKEYFVAFFKMTIE